MEYIDLYAKDGDFYFLKMCEELSELQTAILHYRQGKVELDNVIEEVADVIIQLDKICAYLGEFNKYKTWNVEKLVADMKDQKSRQLRDYINEL